jgi:hypothetical protein
MNAGFRIIQISKLPCHAKHRNICNHKERQAQECKRPDSCGASPSHFPLRKNPNPGFELLHFHCFFFLTD